MALLTRHDSRWQKLAGDQLLPDLDPPRPVVVGCNGTEASLRAVKLAVRTVGDSRTLVLICATRPSRRPEPPTDLHDALKDEAYLLTGQASVGEHLRTAAELAKWHGARLVTTTSEHGSPVPVLQRVAARVGAGAVFIGSDGPRPGWTPRRLGARLDRGVELIVTDGAVHHRRRTAIREVSEPRVSWPASWPAPGLATH